MASRLEKEQIAKNFSKAANSYDHYAQIQKEVASELFLRIKKYIKPGHKILDLGCGTGFLAKLINTEFKKDIEITQIDIAPKMVEQAAKIKNTKTIQADMEKLPLPFNHFDIVVSSLALQWSHPERVLREIKRVKKTDAPFIVSTLGEDSFKEVRKDFKQIQLKNLMSKKQLEEEIEKAKIPNLLIKRQLIKQEYEDLTKFFHTIKNIGASGNQEKKYFDKELFHICKDTKNYTISWEVLFLQNFNN